MDRWSRLQEAEEILRAIRSGEVDAFVIAEGEGSERVFSLSTADRPYRMFVESMRDGAATVSSNGLVLYANRRLATLLSRTSDSIVGSPLASLIVGGAPAALPLIRSRNDSGETIEIELSALDGKAVPVLVGTVVLDVDGDQLTCLTFTDLTDQKAQAAEITRLLQAQSEKLAQLQSAETALTHQATHDALTGLPNRTLLVDRLGQALAQAKRTELCTAVLFIDLDRFKSVNDSHGHSVGDQVLKNVAVQLGHAIREMDTVARIGGDEFVVIAQNVGDSLQAVDIGNRLVDALRHIPSATDVGTIVTASVGISVSVAGRGNAETLLDEADTAMYHAKSLGGARPEVFDVELGRRVRLRSAGRQMLQTALDDHRIVAYYQPIIELSTGQVAGLEALARILRPDGSLVPPADFIPVAEESGLVVPLDQRILDIACRQSGAWRPSEPTDDALTVAVNLSARQFERGNLPSHVAGVLQTSGLPPERLHLELTETAILDLRPEVIKQLVAIRDLGVQIGLDDFGTGYASFTHLRKLPLTFVKIDRSFVEGLGTNGEDTGIVLAVVSLAAHLGLRSIAEGVETTDQLSRLREIGCDQAQGYLFARPMPPGEVPLAVTHSSW